MTQSGQRPEGDRGEYDAVDWVAAEESLANPGIISIPLGFLGCALGALLTSERGAERSFDELYVRSETGLGAEGTPGAEAASAKGAAVPTATQAAIR